MVPLIGTAIAAGISAAQGIGGLIQSAVSARQLRELRKNQPQYETPAEIKQMLDLAKAQARGQMPGYNVAQENLQASTANAISDIQEQGGGSASELGAVADVYSRQQAALNDLAVKQAQYQSMQQDKLGQALQTKAQYSDREFELNRYRPYYERVNELADRRLAGQQAAYQGLLGIGQTAMQYEGNQAMLDAYSKLSPFYTPDTKTAIAASESSLNDPLLFGLRNRAMGAKINY